MAAMQAWAKPIVSIAQARAGANSSPAQVAPFSARLAAQPRRRLNHCAMMVLIAPPPIAAQPGIMTATAS